MALRVRRVESVETEICAPERCIAERRLVSMCSATASAVSSLAMIRLNTTKRPRSSSSAIERPRYPASDGPAVTERTIERGILISKRFLPEERSRLLSKTRSPPSTKTAPGRPGEPRVSRGRRRTPIHGSGMEK